MQHKDEYHNTNASSQRIHAIHQVVHYFPLKFTFWLSLQTRFILSWSQSGVGWHMIGQVTAKNVRWFCKRRDFFFRRMDDNGNQKQSITQHWVKNI